jgi:hypothetical protein
MGVLKVKVNGVWEEAVTYPPPTVDAPDEVIISTVPPRDVSTELWFDPEAVMPSMTDEVWIGPDEPVMFPEVEMWFDTDAPDPPPAEMPDYALRTDTVLKAQVHSHFCAGPTSSSYATWTWTLAAGTYLCLFQMSAVAAVTGIRAVDLHMDGAAVNQSKAWFNAINIHYTMSLTPRELVIPTDGDYTFTLVPGGSATIDVNDFGNCLLIPCEPGAVA